MTEHQKFIRRDNLILRKEFFGGIIFNKTTSKTIELDKEAYYLLNTLNKSLSIKQLQLKSKKRFDKKIPVSKIKKVVDYMVKREFITNSNKNIILPNPNNKIYPNCLSAPETIHLSVTGKCNLNCPFCYGKNNSKDMSTHQIFNLIKQLSELKIFQLAIGGGEPFLRDDLFDIINYCNKNNITVNLTTNGSLINKNVAIKLKNKIGQVNISYHNYNSSVINKVNRTIKILVQEGINTGVNLIVTRNNITRLHNIFKNLIKSRITKIIILRPKPNDNKDCKSWYEGSKLTKKDLIKLKAILNNHIGKINIDCSLVCLMHDIPKRILSYNAVYGCVAGVRFCTINNNGDVFPCSFFNEKEYLAGNIFNQDFKEIWLNSEIFKKFRKMNNKIEGWCRICDIRDYCKGCRRIALEECDDFYGAEKECLVKE